MEDFNSKYTGQQVEDLLDQVASGNAGGGGGGITVETDPIFLASPAASITEAKKTEWDNKMDKVVLSPVATSGNYNDLTNKPTIPASVTESTVSGWGFTKNTGTYSKPSGGIPKSDLASDVRDALRYAEMYQGTVTSVKINGETKGSNGGVVDLGSVGTYSKPSTGIPNSDLSEELREKLETAHRNAMAYQGTVTNIKINGVTKSANNGVVDLGNLGTYSKPSTGIPKSDLNPSVQTSLGKADTAVQPEDIKDEVYITDFDALSLDLLAGNHISSLEFNKRSLKDALAEHKVILVPYEISDNVTVKGYCTLVGFYEDLLYIKVITEYSEFIVDTPLDTQYILNQEITKRNWYDKQDALVSGENIKTINGESILGSGNITINGGGSSGGKEVVLISNGVIELLERDKIYIVEDSTGSRTFEIQSIEEYFLGAGSYAEYVVIFASEDDMGSGKPLSIILPDNVYWANEQIPDLTLNANYELSIVGWEASNNSGFNAVITPFKPV